MMNLLSFSFVLAIATSFCSARDLSGPFLLWGQEKLKNWNRGSLVEGIESDFENLYKNAKVIAIFVRHSQKTRLSDAQLPGFQDLINSHDWTYLPQRKLTFSPFNYNSNTEVVHLRSDATEDEQIVADFNKFVKENGDGNVLGILANDLQEPSEHFIFKRENQDSESTSTPQTPVSDEKNRTSVFVADGFGLIFFNNPPILHIGGNKSELIDYTTVTGSQKANGDMSITITFLDQGEKIALKFLFDVVRGSWTMKKIEVQKNASAFMFVLVGHPHNFPSAPLNFSYRCGDVPLTFTHGNDNLTLRDYQIQPSLKGPACFGEVYDCVGFTTAPIWAGVLVSLFLCGILSIGLMALYDIKTPNKFESSRSKQLTFAVQE